MRGLAFLTGLGAVCVAGAYLLSGLALVFIGGDDYDDVQDRLWLFATLGGLLSVLQLLVYAGLAKRGRWTKYLVSAGVIALVVAGALATSVTALAVTVAIVDVAVVVLLVALQVFRTRRLETLASARWRVGAAGFRAASGTSLRDKSGDPTDGPMRRRGRSVPWSSLKTGVCFVWKGWQLRDFAVGTPIAPERVPLSAPEQGRPGPRRPRLRCGVGGVTHVVGAVRSGGAGRPRGWSPPPRLIRPVPDR